MTETVPNVQLRAWRDANNWTRTEMARAMQDTAVRQGENLSCDEERIGRFERGEVLWPSAAYRRVLEAVTGERAEDLGFVPPHRREHRPALRGPVVADALGAEAELFDTLELARMADASDISPGTVEALEEAADLLCRAYPSVPAPVLRDRTKTRLRYVMRLLGGRLTLDQHRELLVIAGWLAALLGCLRYDLGEREEAEAARAAVYQMGRQAGHGELMGWAYEMAAWFALTEGRYADIVSYARGGQQVAGTSNAMVQLVLQEAKGYARLGDRRATDVALRKGAAVLGQLPTPGHPAHHFVFDHTKWICYAGTCYTWLGDDDRAEEHAREVIVHHRRPDGTTDAPMRTASAHMDLGTVAARRGDLDVAVGHGMDAFAFERTSLTDLAARAAELDRLLRQRYGGERLAREFHERYLHARDALRSGEPTTLE